MKTTMDVVMYVLLICSFDERLNVFRVQAVKRKRTRAVKSNDGDLKQKLLAVRDVHKES